MKTIKLLLTSLLLILSTASFAKLSNLDGRVPHRFIPSGAQEAGYISDCLYSMKSEMIFRDSGEDNLSVKLYIYNPLSPNCMGEPIATLTSVNHLSFKPSVERTESYDYGNGSVNSWTYNTTPQYILSRGKINLEGSEDVALNVVSLMGMTLAYYAGCIGTTPEEAKESACPIRFLNRRVTSGAKSKIFFQTPNQFLLEVDGTISRLRFVLKYTR